MVYGTKQTAAGFCCFNDGMFPDVLWLGIGLRTGNGKGFNYKREENIFKEMSENEEKGMKSASGRSQRNGQQLSVGGHSGERNVPFPRQGDSAWSW